MLQASNYELELMKIIWKNGGVALYNEIVSGLELKGNTWTKNTIITLLLRLIEKGFLKKNKFGNRNKYIAIVSEEDYRELQTTTFINKVYEGSAKGLVSALIQKDLLSSEDYEDLKKYWNSGDNNK